MDEQKSFYLVTAMSESFRRFDEKCSQAIKDTDPKSPEIADAVKSQFRLWEMRIQMAQAQQLTMINETLKKILKVSGDDQRKAV